MTDMLEKVAFALDAHGLRVQGWTEDAIKRALASGMPPSDFSLSNAQAALDAIAESHVVVPVEPTEAMIDAWCNLAVSRIKRRLKDDNDCPGMREGARESYKAMILASQETSDG